MLDQALAGPGTWACPGFGELLRRIPVGGWLKGQVAGPETLRRAGRGDVREIAKVVGANAAWQSERILEVGRLPVIAFDEPSWTEPLDAVTREAVAAAISASRSAGAVTGVHSCGRAPWDDILSLGPDFVNPDVSSGAGAFVAAYEAPLRAHLDRGGWIGWGIVPTDRAVPLGHSRAVLKELLQAIAPLGDRKRTLSQSFLTASCGLAGLTPDRAEDVLRVLFELSRFLRVDHLGIPVK
ncbi:MAG: hypothetical protein HUU15_01600 [Candidatus Brocadiae bacterium]|nr:hypothetical protein [Candidatus Brocadiia bacterium]